MTLLHEVFQSGIFFPQTLQRSWRTVGRKPTGVGPLRALHLPSAVFIEGDLVNPSRKRAGLRKTGEVTPAVRYSVGNYGVQSSLRDLFQFLRLTFVG